MMFLKNLDYLVNVKEEQWLDSHKSRDVLANDSKDSARTIQNYIRLTYLIKQLLDIVDDHF